MSTSVGLLALLAGVVLVVVAADAFVDGLLGLGRRLGVAPFVGAGMNFLRKGVR
jgi:Ca2+/Na+ antiporter